MSAARPLATLLVTLPLLGCATTGPSPAEGPAAELRTIVEGYFEEWLALNPVQATFIGEPGHDDRLGNPASPGYRAASLALEQRSLATLLRLDPARLEGQELLTFQMFKREREEAIEGHRFPAQLLAMNQMESMPLLLGILGSGTGPQPFKTPADYDRWRSRAGEFPAWVDSAILVMREGLAKGVTQPRAAMEKVLPQLDGLRAADPTKSPFYAPVALIPATFSAEDRARVPGEYQALIRDQLDPALGRLRKFLAEEYVPGCRTSVGWSALPDGAAWYRHAAAVATTTKLTPDEIHELGLAEVARIRAEMEAVRTQVGFAGDLHAFFEHLKSDPRYFFSKPEEVLAAYAEVRVRIDAALPRLFGDFPKAGYEIRPVEAFRAQSAPGGEYQQPSADGSRPGVFYVNTFNLKAQPRYGLETLSLHESSPGHHLQIATQQELTGLPRFRRFGGSVAYAEGWALYAESIGKELGLFTDPLQYYGRLNDEMLRAMRLVVDTGLHTRGWSREQAMQYMTDNSSLAATDVEAEVERYLVWPGQALGYKVGQLRISALRRKAEAALGPAFDVRAFHSEVLRDGPLPIELLEAKLDRFVAGQVR